MIRRARPGEASTLAVIHAGAFDRSWDAVALHRLMTDPNVLALADETPTGFILVRVAADEAEILTLAVDPAARRQGLGARLVAAAASAAAERGAISLFLEVAADNDAALALYHCAGFEPAGRRPGYYPRGTNLPVDALVLKKPLTPPA